MDKFSLADLHKKALVEHWAVPHFNFSSLAQLHGILDGAMEMKAPVTVGTSEGERKFVGLHQAVYLVKSFREEYGIPIFLNADHTYSVQLAKEAYDAGYDSIHIDLSKKSYKENLEGVKEVVDYVKSKNSDVQVEGELGYLVTDSSKVYKEVVQIPEDSYTKVEEAVKYVSETGIDRLAPAIGNLHGIAVNEPKLKFDLVENLRKEIPDTVALVLHGGSGISDEDMRRVVESGFNNVHVSTELRIAYSGALRKTLSDNPEEIAPYHYLGEARAATASVVAGKLKVFNTVNILQ